MNFFWLDEDVERSVQQHVDAHVNKIALEVTQVLSTALWQIGYSHVAYDAALWYESGQWETSGRVSVSRAYKPSHQSHPLCRWCHDPVNYMWALWYGIELCKEHKHRCGTIIQAWRVLSQLPRFEVYSRPTTAYAAVADELVTSGELARGKIVPIPRAVELYRQYYRQHKWHLHRWTNRETPEWLRSLQR